MEGMDAPDRLKEGSPVVVPEVIKVGARVLDISIDKGTERERDTRERERESDREIEREIERD